MFERIRGAINGEPRTPTPSHPSPAPESQPNKPPGFLSPNFIPPFLRGDSDHIEDSPLRSKTDAILTPKSKSPGTIRASAAALLHMASAAHPPPLTTDDTPERNSLETALQKRDARLSDLQHDLHLLQNQYRQLSKDHTTLRRQQLESTHRHEIALKLWSRTNAGLQARVECFEKETTVTAAKEIAALIRDAAPQNKDSTYLMMLQEQLNKATIKLDHLGGQTDIVLHKGEEVVESLREEMNEVIRERSRMEIELVDQEKMLEEDKKWMVVKTERRLRRVQGEIDFLERRAVEELKSKESKEEGSDSVDGERDGDGDEEEEEGKEEKEEDETKRERLRQELRSAEKERDRTISLLRAKLFEKNDEYAALMRAREERAVEVKKLEDEKRDRENWAKSREGVI